MTGVLNCQPDIATANFEEWKAAREAYYKADGEYGAAREILLTLGNERSKAWEALVQAAYKLSDSEKKQAAEFEYGPSIPLEEEKSHG